MGDDNILKNTFPQAIRISWEEVESLLWEVFLELKSSRYDPDVVVGIARGGLAPARILVDYLQKKYICTFQMGHWLGDARLSEKPNIIFPLPEVDLSDRNVLVVDDVSDEGGTMEEVISYLTPRVGDIRTAVLISKADSRYKADYCPKVMQQWRWVLFPWSRHEDLLSFTEKVLQITGGATLEEIIRILEDAMSVEMISSEIEKVLFDMHQASEIAEGSNGIWTLI
ncbi:MAG TPA: phosphoribosyltransferase [Deltaproteobacteria bacterium]|nr:phosphoribosyltransferase [Deltaproteobacteria bacterium]